MTLLILLGIIGYCLAIIITKAYIKTYRWTYLSDDDEANIIAIFWPIYIVYRLIAWPFSNASRFIEKKMKEAKQAKQAQEENKKQSKLQVPPQTDLVYQEAEQEIERFLVRDKERHHPL